jgi:hypothetical protein
MMSAVMQGKVVEPLVADLLLSVDGETQGITIVKGQWRSHQVVKQSKEMRNPELQRVVRNVFGAMTDFMK